MCGIFGIINKNPDFKTAFLFRDLFLLSESRGKEASGFAIKTQNAIKVFKTPFPANTLVKGSVFNNEVFAEYSNSNKQFAGIGHSRLVTNGYEQYDINNQPVIKNRMAVIHNGIIVNQNKLWQTYNTENKTSDLDSELIPEILAHEINSNNSFGKAIEKLYNEIYGMTNIALLSETYNNLFLATNNGSVYYVNDLRNGLFIFASERFILQQLLKKHKLTTLIDSIHQLKPGEFTSVDLEEFSFQLQTFGNEPDNIKHTPNQSKIQLLKEKDNTKKIYINTSLEHSSAEVDKELIKYYNQNKEKIDSLKRCIKCILPETFPYIEFDEKGVCNYCNNYQKIDYQGKDALVKVADNYRRKDGKPECLIPFSGGRDSSYALHYVVKELGLKPIAYSYDWGMITDLARRNQARLCGKLGVEHILISADIRNKRENIRKNVLAWLKKPDLGTIPLFMAGDKQYFYYINILMKQNNLSLSILGENLLETTNFKSGFCGIKPKFIKGHTYSLSLADKLKMLYHYGKEYILNPAYINSSLPDTLAAFKSYYVIKHQNLNIFDYLKWDENIISNILLNEYDWETDPDTKTTWRIGDGTAAFYNYIYYMIAGFTENDTFRSNQIREGDLTRDKALELSIKENQPRWDSILWYCKTIGVDYDETIKRINNIEKLYEYMQT